MHLLNGTILIYMYCYRLCLKCSHCVKMFQLDACAQYITNLFSKDPFLSILIKLWSNWHICNMVQKWFGRKWTNINWSGFHQSKTIFWYYHVDGFFYNCHIHIYFFCINEILNETDYNLYNLIFCKHLCILLRSDMLLIFTHSYCNETIQHFHNNRSASSYFSPHTGN